MLQTTIAAIDAEIATRKNEKLGIKFSLDLFNELVKAGKITMATFTAFGTGAFPQQLPAFDGRYYAFIDLDLDGLQFEVGVPN
ncbi:hypothetical protein ELI00_37520 [Rhizobium ruizarguesonis]|uniref:hypothetical protein n=1 Tax=Rhizobium ruizarguesonis TaxID=2081791 RepID=UPI001031F5D9|nr:hypothetical protein [Rhizobium ruizarguesonis]TAX63344.1 hypothetical protein ELI00_37520 [Rhizobium ruizarguesonis]